MEVLNTAKELRAININHDSPDINAPFQSVYTESLVNLNLADKSYFDQAQYLDIKAEKSSVAAHKYFQKEAQYISRINSVLEEGRALVNTLYAFRSCGKAIPQVNFQIKIQVQSHDQANKEMLYHQTCAVLNPEIGRMVDLMQFRDKLISAFSESLTGLIPDVKDRDFFPSEAFLTTLANLLDLTISIDVMKNFKGSMSNDLSMYKRAKSVLVKDQSDPEFAILPKLVFFLANKDHFANDLKKALSTMNSFYEEIFLDMINMCTEYIEKGHYLTPTTKHIYIRATAFAIYLIDGDGDDMDFIKKKKIKPERLIKLFRTTAIVPLFGDIAISIASILAKAPHWPHAKLDIKNLDEELRIEITKAYLLSSQIESSKLTYETVYLQLKRCHIKLVHHAVSLEETKEVYNAAYNGLNLLSQLTTRVLEQAAWKYLNPAKSASGVQLTEIYEQAVQHNYNHEEKKVLIEYIAMIKGLGSLLYTMEPLLQPMIDSHIGNEIQLFAKGSLTDIYNHAAKKKKPVVSILKSVQDALSDNNETVVRADPISLSQVRSCLTKLFFSRALLDLIFNEKSKGMKGGMMKEKNFKESQVAELQKFFDDSHYYPLMINIKKTIADCSDLSNLWFKEFYLELTRQVQFPTSTSLPWILTEYGLESHETSVLQNIFIPLDLYNDAGFKTLNSLKSRYIYNEIEAEVNLCFDQFMFKLGRNVFRHYKKLASTKILDTDNKVGIQEGGKSVWSQEGLQADAYVSALQQRTIKLLGRTVDVSKILSQMMDQYLRHSIDTAISRLEASDLTYMLEFECLLESSRLTHQLLSEYLDLEPFEELLKEIDECVTPGETNGRILTHITQELIRDIIPNYCFNNTSMKFVKSSVFYAEPVQRPHFPNAKLMYLYGTKGLSIEFTMKFGVFKDSIGTSHFNAILNLVGVEGLSLDHTMARFFQSVDELAPPPIVIPTNGTISDVYDSLLQNYHRILHYKELKSEILQAFREIGNGIMLAKIIEEILVVENDSSCFLTQVSELEDQLNSSAQQFSYKEWVKESIEYTRRIHRKPAFIKALFSKIGTSLKIIPEWKKPDIVASDRSIAKVCSILQFAASTQVVSGDRTIRELFGDGLSIAFTSLLFVSGQANLFCLIDINDKILLQLENDEKRRNDIHLHLQNALWFARLNDEAKSFLGASLIQ
ncbi:Cytoplasmic FMR1-interacting protein 2 [Boothiomyces sp. JEL0866]|nr:Cytoplasmic FMR1-interacting protein 2 [Boothiomyces sp. JEL0866]KAJ3322411.1 Cytoplasmic FMR1-interacting protein 2 [Boothiomyces sp. JEL0866]